MHIQGEVYPRDNIIGAAPFMIQEAVHYCFLNNLQPSAPPPSIFLNAVIAICFELGRAMGRSTHGIFLEQSVFSIQIFKRN